ncbi:MAG: hypothetical protein OXE42_05305 [Gammaproteobacteria bacterium]|nr:hypothetical protein [Gammaproteobacteria bacterium]
MSTQTLSKTGILYLLLLSYAGITQADLLPDFGTNDEDLWKSGANLYIRLTDQDKSKKEVTPPNQHPVQLEADLVANALEGIEANSGGGFFKKKKRKTLFSLQQSRLLGQYIATGLSKARPDQDIVFVLARSEKKYVVIQNRGYTGGRVFYLDGKLHLIIGDFDHEGDRFKETVERSHGVTDVKQYFKHGRRAKPTGFKGAILAGDGVSLHIDGKKARRDWLEIDLEQAASVHLAQKAEQAAQEAPTSAAMQAEAARMARERREMRLEMAKMRKEMKSSNGDSSPQTIEQRLATLQDLRDKELISAEEYQQKREQILGEI